MLQHTTRATHTSRSPRFSPPLRRQRPLLTTHLGRWLPVLFFAGLVHAQDAPPAETPPAAPAAPPAATTPDPTLPAPPAPTPLPPADPNAPAPTTVPGDVPPTDPSNALLPDIPAGGIFVPSAESVQKRQRIPYREASESAVQSQIDSALAEVSDRRISLMEAVRIALLNDPFIQIAAEEVEIANASRLLALGQFDARLVTGISYEQRHAELSEAEVAQQQDQYNRNHQLILATRKERKKLERELAELERGGTPDAATKEGTLQQQLDQAAIDLLKQLGIDAGIDVSKLDKLGDDLRKQGIATRKDVLKTLESTERNAVKTNERFPVNSKRRTDTTTFDLAIVKQFRNGIVLSPYYEYDNVQNNLTRRSGGRRINRDEVGIDLSIPLGRGRGTIAASGHLMAAEIDIEASQLSLQHTVANRVLAVVSAYWNLAAAQEQLAYLVRTEVTSSALAALTDDLIKADEVPAASASLSAANRAQAMAARLQGEINLQQAQQTLALAMGVDEQGIIYAPLAGDPLPPLVSDAALRSLSVPALAESAFAFRADYRASRKAIDSGKLLAEQARLNIRPRVDLNFGLFYTGRDEDGSRDGYYRTIFENHAGPGASISLRMDWPFMQHEAKGEYALRQADLNRRREQTRLIDNQIVSGITTANFVLKTSVRELRRQQEAVTNFEKALGTERERFRMGLATMIDAIQTEERLTNARAQLVLTRLLHAQALARLRFETGTLMPHTYADRTSITRANLVTLPVFGARPEDTVIEPRSKLKDAGSAIFGETDPRRVLRKLEDREAARTAPAPKPAPTTPAAK